MLFMFICTALAHTKKEDLLQTVYSKFIKSNMKCEDFFYKGDDHNVAKPEL